MPRPTTPYALIALAAAALAVPPAAAGEPVADKHKPAEVADKYKAAEVTSQHKPAEAAKPAVKPAAPSEMGKPASQPDAARPAAEHVQANSSAAGKPAAAPARIDPIDQLREKLAARLGASKAPDSKSPYVMRVSNAGSSDVQLTTAHAVPRPRAAHAAHGAAKGDAAHAAAHWSYAGEGGPQAWGALKPEFAACARGTRQSPIDIRGGIAVDLEPIRFDYRESTFSVVDNGHTVQANVAPGNSIQVMGRRYELAQFHFHRPSEERIEGRQFEMVAHLVHKDPEGRLAVVAVLLEAGPAQPVVQAVWNSLPLEKGEELQSHVRIDPAQLLPADRRYYTYMGSLTTPPCSEGVLWMVMQQPVAMARAQIDIFARLYPMNARPVQAAAGRLIKQSN
jgi:carbonic anhydrase